MSPRKRHLSPFSWLLPAFLFIVGGCGQTHEVWRAAPEFGAALDSAGIQGTFLLHKMGTNEYDTNDRARAETRFLPASTFKIFNSLVALETGVIADEHETFKWDGVVRSVPAWNQDHDLASAIRVSAVWYYQELARRIGRERMQEWIDRAKYGNQNIGGEIDSFWLKGDIRISPLEQVRFLERLYKEDLPFSHRSMEIVKRILIQDQGAGWTLHGKTGWGGDGDNQVGWYVGYVERTDGVWFFANNIRIVKDEDAWARIPLTRAILARELGIGKEE